MCLSSTPIWKKPSSKFLRRARIRTSTFRSSLMRCLMTSASSGERSVPRALPGLGGERFLAAASSACLAAWRAAQGAAPRMPSRRLPEASLTSALVERARFLPEAAAGGGNDLRAWAATDLRATGGATDLRDGGGTDLRGAGATDLRAAAVGRMALGVRSAARPNGAVFVRDFIER